MNEKFDIALTLAQIEEIETSITTIGMEDATAEMITMYHNMQTLQTTITAYGITPTIETLLGPALANTCSDFSMGNEETVLHDLTIATEGILSSIWNMIKKFFKMIIDGITNFFTGVKRVIKRSKSTLKTIKKMANPVFKNGYVKLQLPMALYNRGSISYELHDRYISELLNLVKELSERIDSNDWTNTSESIVITTIVDLIESSDKTPQDMRALFEQSFTCQYANGKDVVLTDEDEADDGASVSWSDQANEKLFKGSIRNMDMAIEDITNALAFNESASTNLNNVKRLLKGIAIVDIEFDEKEINPLTVIKCTNTLITKIERDMVRIVRAFDFMSAQIIDLK